MAGLKRLLALALVGLHYLIAFLQRASSLGRLLACARLPQLVSCLPVSVLHAPCGRSMLRSTNWGTKVAMQGHGPQPGLLCPMAASTPLRPLVTPCDAMLSVHWLCCLCQAPRAGGRERGSWNGYALWVWCLQHTRQQRCQQRCCLRAADLVLNNAKLVLCRCARPPQSHFVQATPTAAMYQYPPPGCCARRSWMPCPRMQ
jgi:hypothetical protein